MDSQKIYFSIIERARSRKLPKSGSEMHHVVPKCFKDEKQNGLVQLTCREHFLVHLLLVKMQPKGSKKYWQMIHAVSMMGKYATSKTSRQYDRLRILHLEWITAFNREPERRKANSERMTLWHKDPKNKEMLRTKLKIINNEPKVKAEASERMKRTQSDPANKEALKKRSKALWIDPEFKKKRMAALAKFHAEPTNKVLLSKRMKALHADKDFRDSTTAKSKAWHADPVNKAAHSARAKAQFADPEFKAAAASRSKKYHNDPAVKAATSARMKILANDPERKAKFIAQTKARHAATRLAKIQTQNEDKVNEKDAR
jgi:hypothetical protein